MRAKYCSKTYHACVQRVVLYFGDGDDIIIIGKQLPINSELGKWYQLSPELVVCHISENPLSIF